MKMYFWILFIFLLHVQACSGVKVVIPSQPETGHIGASVLVPCHFYIENQDVNYDLLVVQWMFGYETLLTFSNYEIVSHERVKLDKKAAINGDISLLLHNLTVKDEGTYTCSVTYNGKREQKDVELRIQAYPSVEVTRTSTKSEANTHLDCVVKGFYPKEINVIWYRNGKSVNKNVVTGEPQRQENGTYDVNSTLTIRPSEIKEVIECQVEHASLEKPITHSFTTTPQRRKINAATLTAFISMILLIVTVLCSVLWTLLYIMKSKAQVSDEESVIPAAKAQVSDEESVIPAAKAQVSDEESVIPAELPQQTQKADIKVSASERPAAVNISYVEKKKNCYLRAEMESIHRHLVHITWSRWIHDKYIDYNDSRIKNAWSINSDGTFNLTSKLKDKRSASKTAKYFKVRINHASLETPIERIILREEGVYHLIADGDKTPLPQAAEDNDIVCGSRLVPDLPFRD
uniref:Ig-like domain-containing protein n=1 Tax=Leptobrachium leishanense TaxID=445787 RepID=A0A8C5M1E4_9ANUR